jgi:RNA polymerase sigma factor (TIGR02999 family)
VLASDNVTAWLVKWSQGDQSALEQLTPLVYSELHRLAAGYLRQERGEHTLQATALVHEAYLQIRKLDKVAWQNRAQFIGMAAQMMRRILVDHARKHGAQKRGGPQAHKSIEANDASVSGPDLNIVALDQALDKLSRDYPRQAQVVELRFFGGLTTEETVEVLNGSSLNVSSRTVERDWRFARAWLQQAIVEGESGSCHLPA